MTLSNLSLIFHTISTTAQKMFSYLKTFFKNLAQRKPMLTIQAEIDTQIEFRRTLNWFQLLAIGIGAMIGAGIYVLSGTAAAKNAGPSVIVSFLITAIISFFVTLSFAELGTMMPLAGSVYTYTYVALGEYLAWFIGWNSALIYLFGTLTVAASWSKYIVIFIDLLSDYKVVAAVVEAPIGWNDTSNDFYITGQGINIPAIAITIAITILLIVGIRQTAIVNLILVVFKVIILLIFIFACCKYVDTKNYEPFFPTNKGSFGEFGVTGMWKASSLVLFAYVGFDAVATVAQEVRSPERSLPIAIIGSNIISSLLYIGISTVMVGLVSYKNLASDNPLDEAIKATPYGLWLRIILALGGIAGLTTVGMIMMLAQTRIFYAMAHDGLLPPIFCKLHPSRITPWISTLISGIFCAICSGFGPVYVFDKTSTIAALVVYIFVHVCVVVMRFTHKDMPRVFKVPCGRWLIPTVGSILCILLMVGVPLIVVYIFLIWTGTGQVFYFSYGYWHSKRRVIKRSETGNSMSVLNPNSSSIVGSQVPDQAGCDRTESDGEESHEGDTTV